MYRVVRLTAVLVTTLALVCTMNLRGTPAQAGTAQSYLVLFNGNTVAGDAITSAGGTLVAGYAKIGVAVARSNNPAFRDTLVKDSRVAGASTTSGFGIKLNEDNADQSGSPPMAPVSGSEPLASLQWDMTQIHVAEANAITGGSSSVVVGDLDTGLDYTHPDLAPNVDFSRSVSCVGGVPNQDPAAWDDDNGHGTHTAGTIAAAANGLGIAGVAPNVKIAGIKTGNADGFFYPEAVVCAFMWAADHGISVTNNSYFADPWLFNCKNDATQRAIWEAERRAISYAISKGVTVVASAGNDNYDLAHPTTDVISPDDGTPIPREVNNACAIVPAEVPGVITVSANGVNLAKSYYSNYGVGVIQVVAPGGDRRFQANTPGGGGRVLSTYPAKFYIPSSALMVKNCVNSVCGTYAYLQGTSMAGPHVAGVAALIVSKYGKIAPGSVQSKITSTADPLPCPAENPFNPGGTGAFLADCQGGNGSNGFYGHGQVNALGAVTN